MSYLDYSNTIDSIIEVFNDFFGEENVDCHKQSEQEYRTKQTELLIYFPEITIKNERNCQRKLQDLYVSCKLNYNGTLNNTFSMTRATYTVKEIDSGYCHSHSPKRYTFSEFAQFKRMCLGNGPIKSIICQLNQENTKQLWMLFCVELLRYLETESVQGGPYISMENIQNNLRPLIFQIFDTFNLLKTEHVKFDKFLQKFLRSKIFSFYYSERKIQTIPLFDFALLISNSFIDFINANNLNLEYLYSKKILVLCRINEAQQQFYSTYNTRERGNNNQNLLVCTFKNNPVFLQVIQDTDNEMLYNILNFDLVKIIYNKLMNYINCFYEFK